MSEIESSNSNDIQAFLPHKDSPDIYLAVATPEEYRDQQYENSLEWKYALDAEIYVRGQLDLLREDLTKDGGSTGWVLVYQPNGKLERQALCSCETINKDALFSRSGKVEDVTVHAVCSVFCPPKYRGKGYAGRMMEDLGKKLRLWQSDDHKSVLCSVLYSDIGKEFYALRGWRPFPSAHVSLLPSNRSWTDLPETQALKTENLPELCAIDEKLIRQRLSNITQGHKSAVALVPDMRTLKWHHARENFTIKELLKREVFIRGAISGVAGKRVWCVWMRERTDLKDDASGILYILRLTGEDKSFVECALASEENAASVKQSSTTRAISAVLAAAQAEAYQWQLQEIQLWNPTAMTLAAVQVLDPNANIQHRENNSITSLRWYGEDSQDSIDWICNEKYGWC